MTESRILYVVVCACPLALRVKDVLAAAVASGWQPVVIATPDAMGWLQLEATEDDDQPTVSGVRVLSTHRRPDQPKQVPPPDAVVVLATANTLAKMRAGIADTFAHALLCEAISLRVPLVLVPMISSRLGGHPAYREAIEWLRSIDAVVIDPRNGSTEDWKPLEPGREDGLAAELNWTTISRNLPRM